MKFIIALFTKHSKIGKILTYIVAILEAAKILLEKISTTFDTESDKYSKLLSIINGISVCLLGLEKLFDWLGIDIVKDSRDDNLNKLIENTNKLQEIL